jgi:hypothetical protein
MTIQRTTGEASRGGLVWELLTLERLVTGPMIHVVYWCGLGVVALGGFAVIGGAIGVALREGALMGWLLAIPTIVAGLLIIGVIGVLWRSFCELYVVVIRLGEDIHVLRNSAEAEGLMKAPAKAPRR